ncbi:hypothetical protein [Methanobrevibacter sp.]|uniref:hypothetical protein n=1 Tax=Methanobrevibacter sp. TaxID=66852 RepID=UPI0026FB6460|nr:hypothetical protein [Methanobrevibacter sp.]
MARPIGDTPILEGKEAEDFINGLGKPLTKKEKELIKEINSQRRVYFWDKPSKD